MWNREEKQKRYLKQQILQSYPHIRPVPPIYTNPIDRKHAQTWVELHPKELRPMAEKFINNVQHVTFQTFITQLRTTLEIFNEFIGNQKYVLVIRPSDPKGLCSDPWVAYLALDYLKPLPHVLLTTSFSIENYLKNNPITHHILFLDDGSYSGTHMRDALNDVICANFQRKETLHSYIAIPYVAEKAKNTLLALNNSYHRVVLLPHQAPPTLRTLFQSPEELRLLNKYFPEEDQVTRGLIDKSLIYYDHAIPDAFSILEESIKHGFLINDKFNRLNTDTLMKELGYDIETYKETNNFQKWNELVQQNLLPSHPFINPEPCPPYRIKEEKDLKTVNAEKGTKTLAPEYTRAPRTLSEFQEGICLKQVTPDAKRKKGSLLCENLVQAASLSGSPLHRKTTTHPTYPPPSQPSTKSTVNCIIL